MNQKQINKAAGNLLQELGNNAFVLCGTLEKDSPESKSQCSFVHKDLSNDTLMRMLEDYMIELKLEEENNA